MGIVMTQLSRREFLQQSTAGIGAGTALGSLIGLGATLAPATARAQALRIREAKATPSVCPYCSVGCALIVHTIGNEIVNIEGDKRSPHNEGCLCPKGAATYQLLKNPNRATKVLHRKPGAADWEEVELDWAMDRIAQLVKKTRDETFVERLEDGTLWNPAWSGVVLERMILAAMDDPKRLRIVMDFPPRHARYIRMRAAPNGSDAPWTIAELEVWSASAEAR